MDARIRGATVAGALNLGQHLEMCARSPLPPARAQVAACSLAILSAAPAGSGCWTGDETPLGAGPSALSVSAPPRASGRGEGIRAVSYNVAEGRLGLPAVLRTLRPLDADLVGLQEVSRDPAQGEAGHQAALLARALGLRYAYGAHRLVKVPEEGVALLSRYPLSEVTVVPTPPGRRVLLEAVAATPRGPLTVLVVHLRAVGVSVGARRALAVAHRRAEARVAAGRLTHRAGPLLVLGDLNDTPGSETLSHLVPPLVDACAGSSERTWPSGLPLLRLDHVLLRPPLRSLACRAVPSAASDHRPVVADLVF